MKNNRLNMGLHAENGKRVNDHPAEAASRSLKLHKKKEDIKQVSSSANLIMNRCVLTPSMVLLIAKDTKKHRKTLL